MSEKGKEPDIKPRRVNVAEDDVAKGQKRINGEKPKQDKKTLAPALSPLAFDQRASPTKAAPKEIVTLS